MSKENVALARRWMEEVWNQGRAATVRELLNEDSVCYSESGELRGPDAFLDQVHGPLLAAFSDLSVSVEGTVAEGDQVVSRWVCTAVHSGDGLGMPATGKRVTFRGITWVRLKDGKLVEGWDVWNQAGLMQALTTGSAPPSMMLV